MEEESSEGTLISFLSSSSSYSSLSLSLSLSLSHTLSRLSVSLIAALF